MCTVSVSSPDTSYYENWPGPNSISRLCFNRNGTLWSAKQFSNIYMRPVSCHFEALHMIYTWPVSFHFPMQTKKCTSIIIFMLKQQISLKSKKKSMSFFRYLTSGIHWKIFATVFLCFIAGKCHGSVNIATWNDDVKFVVFRPETCEAVKPVWYTAPLLDQQVGGECHLHGQCGGQDRHRARAGDTKGCHHRTTEKYAVLFISLNTVYSGIALYYCILYFIKLLRNNILWLTTVMPWAAKDL